MEVKAKLRYLRISPRKVRLVINLIRGLDVIEAGEQLNFIAKKSAKPVLKLLNSAVANAENNFQLKKENLYIKKITADEGPKLKRWKPRAFGRATPLIKRSSHITIILGEKGKKDQEAQIKKQTPKKIEAGKEKSASPRQKKTAGKKPASKLRTKNTNNSRKIKQ